MFESSGLVWCRYQDAKTPPVEEKRQEPQVGDMVEMVFGRGQVKKIREDGMVEVTAIGWEMAGEQRPHFIMRKDRVKVVPTFYYKLPGEPCPLA